MSAHLFVISSPSGGGKSTIIRALLQQCADLAYSVSMTTRKPRPGELDGQAYWFASPSEFESKIKENAFLEWAEVHGHYYGTLRETIDRQLAEGRSVILDIDVQGGLAVKESMAEAVSVFILPPSMEVLEQRLRSRNTEDEATLQIRLENAAGEMAVADQYDIRVINDDLDIAIKSIKDIIKKTNELP